MDELQKAIQKISYKSKKFPKEEFRIITENKDKSIPYLRSAIEKAIEEKDELEEGYQLHFYALFLLGEFQDKEFFEKIIELITLPRDVVDYLIGDTITSGLKDIVYSTYNGDIEFLKHTIKNEQVDEFVRGALLDVMGQLYLDGILDKNEWQEFIKQHVYSGEEQSYFYDACASMICRCHFVDMLPEIRYMLNYGLMDERCMGKYDSCVDEMFMYKDFDKYFCEKQINAADTLKSWAMFEEDETSLFDEKPEMEFEKLIKGVFGKEENKAVTRKIGRNEPCICGSGKKYKFCCLNKSQSQIDAIESIQERNKSLVFYPYTGTDKQDDRVYLEDYYDAESIEIDKLLYLGLKHRIGLIWLRDEKKENIRCREYLKLAFSMFMDKVKRENIKTFEEYDQRFSIHYFCEEWIEKLLKLLQDDGNKTLYHDVKECKREMS